VGSDAEVRQRDQGNQRHHRKTTPKYHRPIAAAVKEQGLATQEISRNVQRRKQGTQQVSSNIPEVQRGASETGSASSQVHSATKSLSGDSRLKLEVGKFLNTVRAA
jgi:methyl-accepting chemotaxis protein